MISKEGKTFRVIEKKAKYIRVQHKFFISSCGSNRNIKDKYSIFDIC